MAVTDLHIKDIYGGCLCCSDVPNLNKSIVESIPSDIEKLWGSDRPIFIDIPSTFPNILPRFLAFLWVQGWSDKQNQTNDDGEEYDGFHLIVATFIDEISPEAIEKAQKIAFDNFENNAKGWFY